MVTRLMSKGDFVTEIKKLGGLKGSVDYALPLGWVNAAKELGIDGTAYYVWFYPEDKPCSCGEPVHLLEELHRVGGDVYRQKEMEM